MTWKWGTGAMRPWGNGLLVSMLAAVGLFAQTPQNEFVKASEVPTEVLPAAPMVMVAYAFVWVALIVYVFALWRRIGKVERELAQLATKDGDRRRS